MRRPADDDEDDEAMGLLCEGGQPTRDSTLDASCSTDAQPGRREVPLWAWCQLCFAVLAVSTAASAFRLAGEVPPLLLAGWRLQATTVLLTPGAIFQWRGLGGADRQRVLASASRTLTAGICLGFHFGLWVAAVLTTTVPHAALFVSVTPVVLVIYAIAAQKPISRGEIAGTVVAMLGGTMLVFDSKQDKEVSVLGDFEALGGAVAFAVYVTMGHSLRQWMPLFIYALPVTAAAALSLTLAAMAFEGATLSAGPLSVTRYLADAHTAAVVWYLACVPGIVGHTGFNSVLKYIHPLTVTLAMQLEPVLSSAIGWALGVVGTPKAFTWVGGAVVLLATWIVCKAEEDRKRREDKGRRLVGGRRVAEAPEAEEDESRTHGRGRRESGAGDQPASHYWEGGDGGLDDDASGGGGRSARSRGTVLSSGERDDFRVGSLGAQSAASVAVDEPPG